MSKKIKTGRKHRVCRTNGCKHVLSIYNTHNHCHVHQQLIMGRPDSLMAIGKR